MPATIWRARASIAGSGRIALSTCGQSVSGAVAVGDAGATADGCDGGCAEQADSTRTQAPARRWGRGVMQVSGWDRCRCGSNDNGKPKRNGRPCRPPVVMGTLAPARQAPRRRSCLLELVVDAQQVLAAVQVVLQRRGVEVPAIAEVR